MSTFDGGLYVTGKCVNAKFIMNMQKQNIDYVNWVKSTLENITGVNIRDNKDYNTDGCIRSATVRLESKVHPELTRIRDRIYIDGHKVIDPHMLKLMDAEALAIVFMADGCTRLNTRHKNPHGSVELFTCGYSYADNMSLSKTIYDKLNIASNVRKHGKYWKLAIPTKDVVKFARTVEPYVCNSFLYKIERLAPFLELREGGDIVCSIRKRIEISGDN